MPISTKTTYYDILSVGRNATQPEIKQAFRRLAKKYHPDTNPDEAEKAARKLKEVIAAYRVLSNERERARYDVLLQSAPAMQEEQRRSEEMSLREQADQLLRDLLGGHGRRSMATWDDLKAHDHFDLADYMDARDYLDCLFLLAEQCERSGRYREAAELYEKLYELEKQPPRKRYFFEEVKARIKKLYSRKLPREAEDAEEEIGCYERILKFDLDKSEKAFILKKIAEVHCRIGHEDKARNIFTKALELKPGLKGTATIRESLGMEDA
jgi:curved DNA-binding protein CbpA